MATLTVPAPKESPVLWLGLVAFLCLFAVAWSFYRSDPEDTTWNTADIPPPVAPVVFAPGNFSPESPALATGDPLRHRKYPPSLLEASASIYGTF